MNVLVACEESQAVCKAFRARGHRTFSCDIKPCSGGHPEWHIIGDCFELFNGGMFVTESGELVEIKIWDLLIGHPPCTYLTLSGNRWFDENLYADAFLRKLNRAEATVFFFKMFYCGIKRICLENPMGTINSWIKPTQIIQPYHFGDEFQKTTCLWLKNLNPLVHIKKDDCFDKKTHVYKGDMITTSGGNVIPKWYGELPPSENRNEIRSKTFNGISQAMASQLG